VQLNTLFDEVEGFFDFMVTISNNTLRDSIYGMVYRVAMGALLSTVDAATDIYVITTYYETEELYAQANALAMMITLNMISQILVVIAQYGKKSWRIKMREAFICLFFMRPAVDAYRVATNHVDDEATIDNLSELIANKVRKSADPSAEPCAKRAAIARAQCLKRIVVPLALVSTITLPLGSSSLAN